MKPFTAIGKVFEALGRTMDVITNSVNILGDWVDFGKTMSDNEIDLMKKEMDVDRQIRTKELEEKLENRIKAAGMNP